MNLLLGKLLPKLSSNLSGTPAPVVEREQRVALHRCEMRLLFDGHMHSIRVRDIASGGLCGVTDAPLTRMQIAAVELEPGRWEQAQVRWVRNSTVGLAFTEPAPRKLLSRILERHTPPVSRH
jgi:hypothetical protein